MKKPHPSCVLPTLAFPPALTSYLDKMALDAAKTSAFPIEKAKATATRLNALYQDSLDSIQEQKDKITALSKVPCPLPNVPDKDAGIP